MSLLFFLCCVMDVPLCAAVRLYGTDWSYCFLLDIRITVLPPPITSQHPV